MLRCLNKLRWCTENGYRYIKQEYLRPVSAGYKVIFISYFKKCRISHLIAESFSFSSVSLRSEKKSKRIALSKDPGASIYLKDPSPLVSSHSAHDGGLA